MRACVRAKGRDGALAQDGQSEEISGRVASRCDGFSMIFKQEKRREARSSIPQVQSSGRRPASCTPGRSMQLSILFKGKHEQLEVDDGADLSELHDAAGLLFGLVDMTI